LLGLVVFLGYESVGVVCPGLFLIMVVNIDWFSECIDTYIFVCHLNEVEYGSDESREVGTDKPGPGLTRSADRGKEV
jgi:hypothetical protein